MLGDINDGQHSNTANVLTEQPRYLVGDSRGGVDNGLYTAQTLQEYRDTRDVYYTHVHLDLRESLDHVLVSESSTTTAENGCGCLMVSSSTTTISTSTTTARPAPATTAWSKSASHSSPRAPDDAFRLLFPNSIIAVSVSVRVAGTDARQDTRNMGNWKTPGHSGCVSGLTICGASARIGSPFPCSSCPRRGTSEMGTQATGGFALVSW